jgi:predicted CXXCH cytochrome family protein
MRKFFTAVLFLILSASALYGQNDSLYYLGVGQPTDPTTYSCASCHHVGGFASAIYEKWAGTKHSWAMDSLASTLKYNCLQCHNTGWNPLVINYGADEYVDSIAGNNYAISDSIHFNIIKNVQCEACHGPLGTAGRQLDVVAHADTAITNLPNYSASLCGNCHQGAHTPYYEEWEESKHATSIPAFFTRQNNGTCYRCHAAQDFVAYLTDSTYNGTTFHPDGELQPIACVTCHDPHSAQYTAQLRVPIIQGVSNICDKCHTAEIDSVDIHTIPKHNTSECLSGDSLFGYHYAGEVYSNSAHTYAARNRCIDCHVHASPIDPITGIAATGHTFEPRVEACAQPSCHGQAYYSSPGVDTSDPALRFNFNNRQFQTEQLMADLKAQLDAATHEDSMGNAFWEANYNYYACVGEGSNGVHNTALDQKLLSDALAHFHPLGVKNEPVNKPATYSLSQNYPNPFNPTTTIEFSIANAGNVKICVYDVLGNEVAVLANKVMNSGNYEVRWNASNNASGVYFYRIETKEFTAVKKMILIK